MTVKELITKLLESPTDSEVSLEICDSKGTCYTANLEVESTAGSSCPTRLYAVCKDITF